MTAFRRRLGAVIIAAALCPVSAMAQDAADERVGLAVEIVRMQLGAIDLDQLSKAAMAEIVRGNKRENPGFAADAMALAPVIRSELEPMMKDIASATAGFFVENFSADDLRAMKAFYTSDAGRKMLTHAPEFTARVSVSLQTQMKERASIIQEKVKDALRRRGHDL